MIKRDTVSPIEYFQEKVETLLRAVRAGDDTAIARLAVSPRDSLRMRVQHAIAVESGFENWVKLSGASEIELRLVIVMEGAPQLSDFGIGLFDGGCGLTLDERKSKLADERQKLREKVIEVEWLVQWLPLNIASIKTIQRSSYGLKHRVERYSPNKYITNGVFIAAAIIAGYPYKFQTDSANVDFGMSKKWSQSK